MQDQGQSPFEEALRALVRQELARLAQGNRLPAQAGQPTPFGATAQPFPGLQAAAAPAQALAALGAGQFGAPPTGQPQVQQRAAGDGLAGPQQGPSDLNRAMAANLEKLRAVLAETEQIAQKMEQLLAMEGRSAGQEQGQGGQPRGLRPMRARRN